MALSIGNAPPSPLGAVIATARGYFDAAGDATPIMVGDAYLDDFAAGSPPRVLFVPEEGGKIGDPEKVGNEASYTHGCDVFIRSAPGLDDDGRFDNAYALLGRVVSALKRAGGGRLKLTGKAQNDSPTREDGGTGVGLSFSFQYTRDIEKDAAIYGVKKTPPNTVAAYANPPPGTPASSVTFNDTSVPTGP